MTFHSVRKRRTEELGLNGELTLPSDVFEALLQKLKSQNWNSISCTELVDHLEHDAPLPENPVLLSFDDGYLDNFTIAAPIMKRYGFKGTIFVATDFIHPKDVVRPTLETTDHPPERGWLSPAEIRKLEHDGIFEIQSHTSRHSRLPVSLEILNFHRPDSRCWWMERNAASPAQLSEEHHGGTTDLVPWGAPVFQSEWSSPAHAIIPPEAFIHSLQDYVCENGGSHFFESSDWEEKLRNFSARINVIADPEKPEDRRGRILKDLKDSKETLENILNHSIPFLAWPGGGCSSESVELALSSAGYRATFGTNRACEGVARDLRAIPRAYFRQNYRGRFHKTLRVNLCASILEWEAGQISGYWKGFWTRRLMALFANPNFKNNPS
ncbi:MAG: hypothetical protein CMJ96_00655 [Planctomycetes bacterium]|jgi:hypothetical protein|nr:hypothetical protein [Planctomycetota bacterium]MDP6128752.1 polysaccharide deacetylase family protein [Planctomycetota bacterium]MDP7245144.1 polysaccharide deacetylase family protein [Planctomycetota bacterium]|tara:strand:- start:588 stop:1733 length:1146 start_codon:yes stop_codon:yes gene_type:complete